MARGEREGFCGSVVESKSMSFLKKLFKREPEPFMEHPSGDFDTAVDAMADAVGRLRELRTWDKWITFTAQGEAGGPDSYEFAEIRMLGDKLDLGEKLVDVTGVVKAAGTSADSLVKDGGRYSVAAASQKEVAGIFDALFRHHFGIRPFADEDNDYAVGAEW